MFSSCDLNLADIRYGLISSSIRFRFNQLKTKIITLLILSLNNVREKKTSNLSTKIHKTETTLTSLDTIISGGIHSFSIHFLCSYLARMKASNALEENMQNKYFNRNI